MDRKIITHRFGLKLKRAAEIKHHRYSPPHPYWIDKLQPGDLVYLTDYTGASIRAKIVKRFGDRFYGFFDRSVHGIDFRADEITGIEKYEQNKIAT